MRILTHLLAFGLGALVAVPLAFHYGYGMGEVVGVFRADVTADGHAVYCFSPGLSIERGLEAAAHPHTVSMDQAVMDLSDVRPPGGQPEMTATGTAETRLGQATGKKDKRQ